MRDIVSNLRTRSGRVDVGDFSVCPIGCDRVLERRSIVKLAPHVSLPISAASRLLTKGLLLALLSTLATPLMAQPWSALALTQAQGTSQQNTVAEQLLGHWQAKDPKSDAVFTFIFAPEGKLFIVIPASDGSSVAFKTAYRINPTTQPMQLDIELSPKEKALTIFEVTPEGQLRLELAGLNPGQTRPTAFQPNAILLAKTSPSTAVPENIKVIDYKDADTNNRSARKPEDEAKIYMSALTQVQQAHYQEKGKFATKIEDVSIGLRTETESYRYQFLPQGDETQSVMITAVAKNPNLPSYTGAVFATKAEGKTAPIAQICVTEKPSMSPPAMPVVPGDGSSKIQCPSGSRSLV